MPRKRVLITLPSEAYRRLVELADEEERVVDQQASLLLKRLLTGLHAPTGALMPADPDERPAICPAKRHAEPDSKPANPSPESDEGSLR